MTKRYNSRYEERIRKERTKRIRERSGPDSLEWVQSALFLYAAHQEGLGDDLHKAIWAYTAAMIERLEHILTEAEYITGAQDIAEEYRWAAKQLRVAITRHLQLIKMFEREGDVTVPAPTPAGEHIEEMVHRPQDTDTAQALKYIATDFKQKHTGYDAVIPSDTRRSY